MSTAIGVTVRPRGHRPRESKVASSKNAVCDRRGRPIVAQSEGRSVTSDGHEIGEFRALPKTGPDLRKTTTDGAKPKGVRDKGCCWCP